MKDQFGGGVRCYGVFSNANILAYGVYMGSGHVNYTGGPPAGLPAGSKYTGQFIARERDSRLRRVRLRRSRSSLGMFGANITYAGASVFGNVLSGDVNGTLALD